MKFNIYILILVFIQNGLFGLFRKANSKSFFQEKQKEKKNKIKIEESDKYPLYGEKDLRDQEEEQRLRKEFEKKLTEDSKIKAEESINKEILNPSIFKGITRLNKAGYDLFKKVNEESIKKAEKYVFLNSLKYNKKYQSQAQKLFQVKKFEIPKEEILEIQEFIKNINNKNNNKLKEFNKKYEKYEKYNFNILISNNRDDFKYRKDEPYISSQYKEELEGLLPNKININKIRNSIVYYYFDKNNNHLFIFNLIDDNYYEIKPTKKDVEDEQKKISKKLYEDKMKLPNKDPIEKSIAELYFKHDINDFIQTTIFNESQKFPKFQFISDITNEINNQIENIKISENFYSSLLHEMFHYFAYFLINGDWFLTSLLFKNHFIPNNQAMNLEMKVMLRNKAIDPKIKTINVEFLMLWIDSYCDIVISLMGNIIENSFIETKYGDVPKDSLLSGDFEDSFINLYKLLNNKIKNLTEEIQIEIYKKAYINIIGNIFTFLNSNLYKDDKRTTRQILIDMSNNFLLEKVISKIQDKIKKTKEYEEIEINIKIPIKENFFKSKNIDIKKLKNTMIKFGAGLEKNFNKYIDEIIDEYEKIDDEYEKIDKELYFSKFY